MSDDDNDDDLDFPHERLEVYRVLRQAFQIIARWTGVPVSRGTTGDQLHRAMTGAILRYTEGFYAQAGNQAALWSGSRSSCGEAASAIDTLVIEGRVPRGQAHDARALLCRAMRMLWGLCHRR